jgi:hypothetical protein
MLKESFGGGHRSNGDFSFLIHETDIYSQGSTQLSDTHEVTQSYEIR